MILWWIEWRYPQQWYYNNFTRQDDLRNTTPPQGHLGHRVNVTSWSLLTSSESTWPEEVTHQTRTVFLFTDPNVTDKFKFSDKHTCTQTHNDGRMDRPETVCTWLFDPEVQRFLLQKTRQHIAVIQLCTMWPKFRSFSLKNNVCNYVTSKLRSISKLKCNRKLTIKQPLP